MRLLGMPFASFAARLLLFALLLCFCRARTIQVQRGQAVLQTSDKALDGTESSAANAPLSQADVLATFASLPPHPRLILSASREQVLRDNVAAARNCGGANRATPQCQAPLLYKKLANNLFVVADALLDTTKVPVMPRVLEGFRLLSTSGRVLSRVINLGIAWRISGEKKYANRAIAELLNVAAFSSDTNPMNALGWNPSHFLDVAEMTAAVAIGYDWFYSVLDTNSRSVLRQAIVTKGLNLGISSQYKGSFTTKTNNWNQVCNAGLVLGALAVAETDTPESNTVSADIIAQAINTLPISMNAYNPDGTAAEGPGYWEYGSGFTAMMLDALDTAIRTDFGLMARYPSFRASADYFLHVKGPSGYWFNYADCSVGGLGVSPTMFWFAAKSQQSYLLWDHASTARTASWIIQDNVGTRLNALILLWMSPELVNPVRPTQLFWTGNGDSPIAIHRSGWDSSATFVAIKAGMPSSSHGHMDEGTFVMDADGVRWAHDLGSDNYNKMETAIVPGSRQFWNPAQTSQRWDVFRLGVSSHSVLTFSVDGVSADEQRRRSKMTVNKVTSIVFADAMRSVVDVTAAYGESGVVKKAVRGVVLQSDRTVLITDDFTITAGATVRWAMLVWVDCASISIRSPTSAVLTKTVNRQTRTLEVRVLSPVSDVSLELFQTNPPPSVTIGGNTVPDSANDATCMLGFRVRPTVNQPFRTLVQLIPGSAAQSVNAVSSVYMYDDWMGGLTSSTTRA